MSIWQMWRRGPLDSILHIIEILPLHDVYCKLQNLRLSSTFINKKHATSVALCENPLDLDEATEVACFLLINVEAVSFGCLCADVLMC